MELIRTLGELKQFSFLLRQTVVREIRVRYKQTFVGILWAVLQPLVFSTLFFLLFGVFRGGLSDGEHFVTLFFGTSMWMFFSNSISFATNSISGHPSLVTKVSFPRIVFPLSFVAVSLIDLVINLLVACLIMLVVGKPLTLSLLVWGVPILCLLIGFTSVVAVLLAGVNVFYRDFRYLVPISIQVMIFLTPVFYSLGDLQGKILLLVRCNPLSVLFDSFQRVVVGQPVEAGQLAVFALGVVLFAEAGLRVFRLFNTRMADVI